MEDQRSSEAPPVYKLRHREYENSRPELGEVCRRQHRDLYQILHRRVRRSPPRDIHGGLTRLYDSGGKARANSASEGIGTDFMCQREDERNLIRSALQLWVSVRMESRSERIIGDETLGMQPQTHDPECHNYSQFLVPPLMSAQIELIATCAVLNPMRKLVLGRLRNLIEKNMSRSWFTIYLCLFIILHSCALLTEFENRQARKYGLPVGDPSFLCDLTFPVS